MTISMNNHYSLVDFMDLLLDAVCVVDKDGQFVFVSAACEHVFGYTPEEIIGRKMIDMVVPEDRPDEQDEQPESRPLNSGTLSGEVIRSGHPILLTPDTRITVSPGHSEVIGTDSMNWLGVPLKARDRTIGAVVVQSYNGDVRYSEQDQELLQFVSTQVASAILRTQLHERLRYAAGHDPLTGLANRGLFQDRFQGFLTRVRREHTRFALLYIDLNRFKKVNDDHGHITGDLLLQEVAKRLRGCIRESDTIARVGGDEFIVLLDAILLPLHAVSVSIKINQALRQIFLIDNKRLLISPSIGVSVYPEDGDNEDELMRHADEAMYYFKRQRG